MPLSSFCILTAIKKSIYRFHSRIQYIQTTQNHQTIANAFPAWCHRILAAILYKILSLADYLFPRNTVTVLDRECSPWWRKNKRKNAPRCKFINWRYDPFGFLIILTGNNTLVGLPIRWHGQWWGIEPLCALFPSLPRILWELVTWSHHSRTCFVDGMDRLAGGKRAAILYRS